VSVSNKENFQIFLLQEYHRRGLAARLGLVQFFIEQLHTNLKNPPPNPQDETFGLTANQRLALLQIGAVSQIMMLLEDIAILCTTFLKNEPEYYRYLDGKGEEDLGKIIGEFYDNIDSLTQVDCRKIMSYPNPDKYKFPNRNMKKVFISTLPKSTKLFKYFLGKSSAFYLSHIGFYRRYKHAGFPIILASEISKNDSMLYRKYDFVSFAFTSRKTAEEEVSTLPFSKDVIKSYHKFFLEIYFIFFTIINYRLIAMQRKLDGIVTNPEDYFGQILNNKEKIIMKTLYNDFEKKYPTTTTQFHTQISSHGMYPPWYVYLESHYSKSTIDLAFKKKKR